MKIKEISYTKMLKLELPYFAKRVIKIIEEHDPEKLKIKEKYDMLVAQMPNIDLLKWPYSEHPLTKPKREARQSCLRCARSIVRDIHITAKVTQNNSFEAVLYANAFVKQYLHRLDLSKNENILIERVIGFLTALKDDEEMQKAFTEYGLNEETGKLEKAVSVYKELLMKRTLSMSQRCQVKTKDIVAPVRKSLKYMFATIEVGIFKYPDIDYSPLINTLNQAITEMKNKINRRALHNKSKAKKQKLKGSDS